MLNLKPILFALILTAALTASATYAWSATWHGTGSMVEGGIITAQEIAENFEYLKAEIDAITGGGGGGDTLADLNCSSNQIAKYINGSWQCASDNTGGGGGPGSCVTRSAVLVGGTVNCASGEIMTGGGCMRGGSGTQYLNRSTPNGNGWRCYGGGSGVNGGGWNRAYVRCCK